MYRRQSASAHLSAQAECAYGSVPCPSPVAASLRARAPAPARRVARLLLERPSEHLCTVRPPARRPRASPHLCLSVPCASAKTLLSVRRTSCHLPARRRSCAPACPPGRMAATSPCYKLRRRSCPSACQWGGPPPGECWRLLRTFFFCQRHLSFRQPPGSFGRLPRRPTTPNPGP